VHENDVDFGIGMRVHLRNLDGLDIVEVDNGALFDFNVGLRLTSSLSQDDDLP
jgi:hypothetical protein